MKLILYTIIVIMFFEGALSEQFKIIEPKAFGAFCSSDALIIKVDGLSGNFNLEYSIDESSSFRKIQNYTFSNNTIIWQPNVKDCFDKPISFRISDSENPSNYDEVENIIINSKTEILDQTSSITICENQDCQLKIDALGYNLTYQWFKDGQILFGETSNLLSLTNTNHNQSGAYTCSIMTNGICKETVSKPIPVYVATKTKFVQKPNDVQYGINEAVSTEKVYGRMEAKIHVNNNEELKNIKFQWWKDSCCLIPFDDGGGYWGLMGCTIRFPLVDDGRITGSNDQILQISDMRWGDRANYWCIATGLCGSDTTRCYIGENTHFTIKNNIRKFDDCEGGDATLSVTVKKKFRGRLAFQWYRIGKGKIYDSEKYIGTNTSELTIKNTNAVLDNTVFYCIVTLLEYNISQFSDEFAFEPSKVPKIVIQPRSTIIKDKTNRHYGQTYIDVIVENGEGSLYTWYRNGVQARKTCWISDYWLGIDSCPEKDYAPPPRPPVKEDVGWYKCKIENKCGTFWSDSAYISWGYDDILSCKGSDIVLRVDDFGNEFIYHWEKDKKQILETSRFKNTTTNNLLINDLEPGDEGYYYAYIKSKNSNNIKLVGKILVEVKLAPYLSKDFPKELVNDGLYMKQAVATVITPGPVFYYQLYIDGEPAEPLQKRDVPNYLEKTHPFILGGYNSNLKPGKYKYYFKNDCGDVWTSELKITNSAYKPKGIPIEENDDLPSDISKSNFDRNIIIYPNPASDFITITLPDNSNHTLQGMVENGVQIFNTLGIEVSSAGGGGYRIDISHLPAGVYFIKIGDKVEKFVKI